MLTRRQLLTRSTFIGCSLAASPLLTPLTLAAAPWDNRLVVIILRGAMDGLDVVMPVGDREFGQLRPDAAAGGMDLTGFYALHPSLAPLMPMWQKGELAFAHAVSTPYRDKRSHFDGQDLLEAGINDLSRGISRDGWLNRMMQVAGIRAEQTAYSIGREGMLILDGAAPVSSWSPEVDLAMSPQAIDLARLLAEDDPAFAMAFEQALMIADGDGDSIVLPEGEDELRMMMSEQRAQKGAKAHLNIAQFAAQHLREETRIASFSISGWDTHNRQSNAIQGALVKLAETLNELKNGLEDVWGKTTVIAMTEFGRTARYNGTQGTDHGTGGAMIFAGGAIRGGQVYGDWPGLAEANLYNRRDLMPTRDVRAYAGWAIQSLFGLSTSDIEKSVFPGLDMQSDPKIIL